MGGYVFVDANFTAPFKLRGRYHARFVFSLMVLASEARSVSLAICQGIPESNADMFRREFSRFVDEGRDGRLPLHKKETARLTISIGKCI